MDYGRACTLHEMSLLWSRFIREGVMPSMRSFLHSQSLSWAPFCCLLAVLGLTPEPPWWPVPRRGIESITVEEILFSIFMSQIRKNQEVLSWYSLPTSLHISAGHPLTFLCRSKPNIGFYIYSDLDPIFYLILIIFASCSLPALLQVSNGTRASQF